MCICTQGGHVHVKGRPPDGQIYFTCYECRFCDIFVFVTQREIIYSEEALPSLVPTFYMDRFQNKSLQQ